jgi:hypothetical protein
MRTRDGQRFEQRLWHELRPLLDESQDTGDVAPTAALAGRSSRAAVPRRRATQGLAAVAVLALLATTVGIVAWRRGEPRSPTFARGWRTDGSRCRWIRHTTAAASIRR